MYVHTYAHTHVCMHNSIFVLWNTWYYEFSSPVNWMYVQEDIALISYIFMVMVVPLIDNPISKPVVLWNRKCGCEWRYIRVKVDIFHYDFHHHRISHPQQRLIIHTRSMELRRATFYNTIWCLEFYRLIRFWFDVWNMDFLFSLL